MFRPLPSFLTWAPTSYAALKLRSTKYHVELDGFRGPDTARSQHRQLALYTKAGRHSGHKWANRPHPSHGRYPVSIKRPALNRPRAAGAVNTEQVDSFVIMNARCIPSIALSWKRGEIFVAMENLLDANYAYRPGYPMPGRWGQIGLSASF